MTKELQVETIPQVKSHKMAKLVVGILFDLIGMISYVFPGFAEIIDVIWAPISGLLLALCYQKRKLKFSYYFIKCQSLQKGWHFYFFENESK